MKVRASHPFRPRSRRTLSSSSGALALGLLALAPAHSFAQPADTPPTDAALSKLREEMLARRRSSPPPRETEVWQLALSPDGKMAVSVDSQGIMSWWDTATGKDLHTVKAYAATDQTWTSGSATFSPDGKRLFTTGIVEPQGDFPLTTPEGAKIQYAGAKLWDVASRKLLWTIPGPDAKARWDATSGYLKWTFPGPNAREIDFAPGYVAFSPDGKLLATKGNLTPVTIWDATNGKLVKSMRAPFMQMKALAFSPDGKKIAGGGYHYPSYNQEILFWDVASGELERTFKAPGNESGAQIEALSFSPDGKMLAVGGASGQHEEISESMGRFNIQFGMTQLWDVKSGVLLTTVGHRVHRNIVTTLAFSPDGKRLATGSLDRTAGLWDTETGLLLASATRYGTDLGLPPVVTNAEGVRFQRSRHIFSDIGVKDVAFSPDGKTLTLLGEDKSARTWDVSSPSPSSDPIRRIIPSSGARYTKLTFAPNGRSLVTGDHGYRVRFWRTDNQRETSSFIAHRDPVLNIAMAPPGPDEFRSGREAPLMATASTLLEWKKTGERTGGGFPTGFEVKLWNSKNQELLHTFTVPGYSVTSLALSPGSRWIAASGGKYGPRPMGAVVGGGLFGVGVGGPENANIPVDSNQQKSGVVVIWDAQTGELKHKIPVAADFPIDLKFSPDGTLLAGDADEAGLILWSTETGEILRTLDEDLPPALKPGQRRMRMFAGSPTSKTTLAFGGNGTWVARSRKGVVKLWNVKTGVPFTTLEDAERVNKDGSFLIALTPDGKVLAMADQMEKLTLWDVPTGKQLWQLPGRSQIDAMEMASDGKTLATSSGNEIRLWDISEVEKGVVQ